MGVGITNQRETTVAWDKVTGKPLHNAIVWHDNRTKDLVAELKKKEQMVKDNKDQLKKKSGLPLSTYFSASKVMPLLNRIRRNRFLNSCFLILRCFLSIYAWMLLQILFLLLFFYF